jgi:hypothetical protein
VSERGFPVDASQSNRKFSNLPPDVSPFAHAHAGQSPLHGRRLSDILTEIADDTSPLRVSVVDLLAAMPDRAFGALMFIFALPNVLPTPPGTSTVLSVPLIFLATQLTLGQHPWLPRLIANRSMARTDFAALIARTNPRLARAERLLRPRLAGLVQPPFEYAIGVICLLLAVILFLPIPFGNNLPALAICMFSLGIMERDGVCVLIGLLTAVASIVLIWGIAYAFVTAVVLVFTNAFN